MSTVSSEIDDNCMRHDERDAANDEDHGVARSRARIVRFMSCLYIMFILFYSDFACFPPRFDLVSAKNQLHTMQIVSSLELMLPLARLD